MSDESQRKIWDVVIVGAGISGLSARRILRSTNFSVLTIEKSRGLGGRSSTKRTSETAVDLGAQFFSVRTENFKSFIDEFSPDLFRKVTLSDSPRCPRYCLVEGMSRLAKCFVEFPIQKNLPIMNSVRVQSIRGASDDLWHIECDNGLHFCARSVLVTAPLPQGLDLIEDVNNLLTAHHQLHLRDLKFDKCLAGIFHLSSDLSVATDGIWRNPRSELTGIYNQGGKGIKTNKPVLAVHGAPDFSEHQWENDETSVVEQLLRLAVESLNVSFSSVRVDESYLKKWRYCQAKQNDPAPFVALAKTPSASIYLAGDAFSSSKVEGAFESGRKAALAIAEKMKE